MDKFSKARWAVIMVPLILIPVFGGLELYFKYTGKSPSATIIFSVLYWVVIGVVFVSMAILGSIRIYRIVRQKGEKVRIDKLILVELITIAVIIVLSVFFTTSYFRVLDGGYSSEVIEAYETRALVTMWVGTAVFILICVINFVRWIINRKKS